MKNILLILLIILALDQISENRNPIPDTTTAEFITECVLYHNFIRKRHKASNLVIKPNLIRYAMERLKVGTKHNKLEYGHKNLNETLGENIYWARGKASKMNCSEAIEKWYIEIKDYDFEAGLYSKKTGHFTQMVWIGSTEVGCARSVQAVGKKFEVYIECIYGLSGNYRGEFTKNVKKADDQAEKIFKEAQAMHKKLNRTNRLPTKRFQEALNSAKGDKMLRNSFDDDEYEISVSPIKDITRFAHCFDYGLILQNIFSFDCNRAKTNWDKRLKNFKSGVKDTVNQWKRTLHLDNNSEYQSTPSTRVRPQKSRKRWSYHTLEEQNED